MYWIFHGLQTSHIFPIHWTSSLRTYQFIKHTHIHTHQLLKFVFLGISRGFPLILKLKMVAGTNVGRTNEDKCGTVLQL